MSAFGRKAAASPVAMPVSVRLPASIPAPATSPHRLHMEPTAAARARGEESRCQSLQASGGRGSGKGRRNA